VADEYQKELFEEFGKEKGKLKRIAEKIGERRHRLYLQISPENAVFAAIVVLMCVIVAFALGVERGKRLTPQSRARRVEKSAPKKKPEAKKEPEVKTPAPPVKAGIYAIQLISYKKKQLAEKEKRDLSGKNIEAFIVPSGEWFQVCAGSYADIESARKALEKFSKDYKGCFIRKKEKEREAKNGTTS